MKMGMGHWGVEVVFSSQVGVIKDKFVKPITIMFSPL
jgi:hypothetical protein